jgi:hypothetical protein
VAITLKIDNKTHYRQRDLRKIILAGLKEYAIDSRYRAEVAYSRRACKTCKNRGEIPEGIGNRLVECWDCAKRAVIVEAGGAHDGYFPIRILKILLPKTGMDMPRNVIANMALSVASAIKYRSGKWGNQGENDMPAWAPEIRVGLQPPKPKPTTAERVNARAARVAELLAKWQRKAKVAATKIRILKRKYAYYQKKTPPSSR